MITVCIATFNGEKYIREQLNSILFQLSLQDEVIVSDDGSTDNTISIIKSFNDKRIKIIDGVYRHSPTLNFENALKEAKGDYIFLADQDDVWKDDKVKICLKWLQHYDCIISDAEVTDENLKITSPSLYQLMNIKSGRVYNILYKNGYTGCCMAFTKRVKEAALPFPKDIPICRLSRQRASPFKGGRPLLMRSCARSHAPARRARRGAGGGQRKPRASLS